MATVEERLQRQLDLSRTAQERSEVATKRLKIQADALEARIKGTSIEQVEADQPARGKSLTRQSRKELLLTAKELRIDVPEDATVEQIRDALAPRGFPTAAEQPSAPLEIKAVSEAEVVPTGDGSAGDGQA
jgi:hypothetical protein